jgi:cell division transport system permease protein
MRLGILSSLFAISGLAIVFIKINQRFPELKMLDQPLELGIVFGGVLVLGIGITGLSTFFATQRYLNLKSDAIY